MGTAHEVNKAASGKKAPPSATTIALGWIGPDRQQSIVRCDDSYDVVIDRMVIARFYGRDAYTLACEYLYSYKHDPSIPANARRLAY